MKTLESLIDLVVDTLLSVSDYFILKKHATLSEGVMFAFSAILSMWYAIVGRVDLYGHVLSDQLWALIFGTLSVMHVIAFVLGKAYARGVVVSMYAFLWCFLLLIFVWQWDLSLKIPSLTILTFYSAIVAARLLKDPTFEQWKIYR